MMTLRRGVGRRSRIVQTELRGDSPTCGRLSPRARSARIEPSVNKAATRRSQSGVGSASRAISTGESRDVSAIVRAVITIMNSPRVEKINRPNSATRIGRTMRLTTTKIAPQTR